MYAMRAYGQSGGVLNYMYSTPSTRALSSTIMVIHLLLCML